MRTSQGALRLIVALKRRIAISVEVSTARSANRRDVLCFLLVFLCFTGSSTCWLEWFYHLLDLAPDTSTDTYTLVFGYLVQAAAMLVMAVIASRRPRVVGRPVLLAALVLQMACTLPAVTGETLAISLIFGYAMSACIGIIASAYLDRLARFTPTDRRGTVFGGGYACSVVVSWLLSMVPASAGSAVTPGLIMCVVLTALAVIVAFLVPDVEGATAPSLSEQTEPSSAPALCDSGTHDGDSASLLKLVALAAVTVFLMSLVKNLGSSFSSAGVAAGVSIESSRMFYAAGLVIAGVVTDRSRKYGAICCTAALVTPFALMALSGEPLPGLIIWAIDYFFFGFFAVYRVVLFSDMAANNRLFYLASLGLLFGRIGDALGTAMCQTLATHRVFLVLIAAIAFVATAFALFRLFQRLYTAPANAIDPAQAERVAFEEFAARYDLSTRERDVLSLILDSRTNAEIASELFIAEGTVKFHVGNLLKKTDCRNRTDLRAKYLLHRDAK